VVERRRKGIRPRRIAAGEISPEADIKMVSEQEAATELFKDCGKLENGVKFVEHLGHASHNGGEKASREIGSISQLIEKFSHRGQRGVKKKVLQNFEHSTNNCSSSIHNLSWNRHMDKHP